MTVEATIEPESSGAEGTEVSDVQAQANAEAAAESAALEVLKAARATPADAADGGEAAKPAEEVVPAKDAATIPDPAKVEPPTAAKADDASVLLERLNTLEASHRAATAEVKTLREAAARAAKYDALAKASAEGDIATVAKELGWSPEGILKYIEDGKDGVKDVVTDKKLDAVGQKLASLEQQLANERAERAIVEYKGTISREFSSVSKDVPFLVNDFTDPETGAVNHAGMVEAIWDLQVRLHNEKQQTISIEAAAKALNGAREKQLKRLQGKPANLPANADAPAKASATPASKQVPVTKTTPRVALPKKPAADPHEEDALATLRTYRQQREAAATDLE